MSKKDSKKDGGKSTDVKKVAGKKATATGKTTTAPGISIDDVNEATGVAEKIINFPPDAPSGNGKKKPSAEPAETTNSTPATEAEAFPPDAPVAETTPETPAEEVVHAVEHVVEEAIEEVAEKAAEAIEHIVDDNVANGNTEASTPPTETPAPTEAKQPSVQEQLLEKWLNGRREINHFELASSGVVNLNYFKDNLEGQVGKFRFKRTWVGDNWKIEVVE